MTDDQKNRIKFYLNQLEGIEKADEIIESIQFIQKNKLDSKITTYISWIEDKNLELVKSRQVLFQQLESLLKNNLIIVIFIYIESTCFLCFLFYFYLIKLKIVSF
jgi:hypothetical protein